MMEIIIYLKDRYSITLKFLKHLIFAQIRESARNLVQVLSFPKLFTELKLHNLERRHTPSEYCILARSADNIAALKLFRVRMHALMIKCENGANI